MDEVNGFMKNSTSFVLILLAVFCGGCVSVDRALTSVERVCAKQSTLERLEKSDWIIIGNLFGGMGSFEKLKEGRAFAAYSDCSEKPSSLRTEDELRAAIAGWTLLEISRFRVPLLFSVHSNMPVLVPHKVIDRDDFDVGIPGVWMGYGNLVAARWTPDQVFVISEVLCETGDGYQKCARQYERGLFDLATGIEHTRTGEPIRNPVRIDTNTYKKLDENTDHVSAN